MLRVSDHRPTKHEKNSGEQCRERLACKVTCEVVHEQSGQEEMRDDLDFHQPVGQRPEWMKEHEQPIRWVENLSFGIPDYRESAEYIWVPEWEAQMPQFFVDEREIRVKETVCIPRKTNSIGKQYFRIRRKGQKEKES